MTTGAGPSPLSASRPRVRYGATDLPGFLNLQDLIK